MVWSPGFQHPLHRKLQKNKKNFSFSPDTKINKTKSTFHRMREIKYVFAGMCCEGVTQESI